MTVKKIISGGQTGADQGALAAAKALGLTTGGWMPKGFRTEAGPRPEFAIEYGICQHSSTEYPPRTHANVLAADATLIFGNEYSPGCRLTANLCRNAGRPCLVIPWRSGRLMPSAKGFLAWLEPMPENGTLNVAGNRESKQPGIFAMTRDFLILALSAGGPSCAP